MAVASNAPFSAWGQTFTDPRLAAAVVDRLTFRAHIIETGTESYRPAGHHCREGRCTDQLITPRGWGPQSSRIKAPRAPDGQLIDAIRRLRLVVRFCPSHDTEVTLHQHEHGHGSKYVNSVLARGRSLIGQFVSSPRLALMDLSERHVEPGSLGEAKAERYIGVLEALDSHGNRGRLPPQRRCPKPWRLTGASAPSPASALPGRQPTPTSPSCSSEHRATSSSARSSAAAHRGCGPACPARGVAASPQHRDLRAEPHAAAAGMLLQLDGSHHSLARAARPIASTLLLAVDDATGTVVHALFERRRVTPAAELPAHARQRAAPLQERPARPLQRPPRRLPWPPPSSASGRRGEQVPVRAGDGGAGGPPDLRPLTAGR